LDEGSIKAGYINTQDQLADLLTNSLGRVKFQELRATIGMVQIPQKAPRKRRVKFQELRARIGMVQIPQKVPRKT
jgi:hypothetical protein